jgi:aminomethyltransferase
MPIASPFHPRTAAHCTSLRWKDWAGYYAVCSYETTHDSEYFAFRHSAGLIDVSPLYKYEITGKDAAAFLSRVTVRDVHKLKTGRVTYLCWCDDDGKVIDDGTVAKLADGHYRLTAAEPSLAWLNRFTRGYDVKIEDSTTRFGALSLQGPNARGILKACVEGDVAGLKFFGIMPTKLAGLPVWVSRTGYTGDLGYEVWCESADATRVYDALLAAGEAFAIMPAGLDAMDVTRIEAGFIMNGVDYFSAHHCLIEERKSSPFEIGLGWTVELERPAGQPPFVGQEALKREKAKGSEWQLVGLDVDWVETEALFAEYGLPPEVPSAAWRTGKPVYDLAGSWIGMATSGAWSPILKRNLALAQIATPFAREGQKVKFEVTVEYRRHTVTATVAKLPFYNPERKRS